MKGRQVQERSGWVLSEYDRAHSTSAWSVDLDLKRWVFLNNRTRSTQQLPISACAPGPRLRHNKSPRRLGNLQRLAWSIATIFFIMGSLNTYAQTPDCRAAKQLFDQSLHVAANAAREELLTRAVEYCPTYAPASNNLAFLKESDGRFEEAGRLYQKAIDADPEMANAYAGLGDVRRSQGRHREAVCAYRLFLELAERQKKDGDPHPLASHISDYRDRLEESQTLTAQTGLASSDEIANCLSMVKTPLAVPGTRGIQIGRIHPRIDIRIHFEFGRHRLTPAAEDQLGRVAQALRKIRLKNRLIVIEGHTDNVGSAAYNLSLSAKRAVTVRDALVVMGIDAARLNPKGLGESNPIATNQTKDGRALNRRVSFINAGGI